MQNNLKFYSLICFFYATAINTAMPEFSNKHIFFDVGHVLVTPSALHALWYIGPQTILKYILYYKKIPARTLLQKRLFDFINYATALPTHASIHSCSCELPQIMYEWIVGKKTTVELLSTINNSPLKDQFFDSAAERDLVLGLTNLFKPEYYVGLNKLNLGMLALLQQCLQKYPNQVYILSNWDESYHLLKSSNPAIFKNMPPDHIIFSHQVGYAKPDQQIFDYVAKQIKLEKRQCILIDDLAENITGITQWGGLGILHINPAQTQQTLERLLNEQP